MKSLVLILVAATFALGEDPMPYPENYSAPSEGAMRDFGQNYQSENSIKQTEKISEFTGSVAFSYTLFNIGAKNGLFYGINLGYHGGNTEKNNAGWKRVDKTSWLGLGFDLALPVIDVVNKKAVDLRNDVYRLRLPGIAECELLEGPGNLFTCKTNPTVKVRRVISGTNPNEVDYWILTSIDGSTYEFGSRQHCDDNSETCKQSLPHRVGSFPACVLNQSGTLPVKWFLKRISDRQGVSHINFEYSIRSNITYFARVYSENNGSVIQNVVFSTSLKNNAAEYDCPSSDYNPEFECIDQKLDAMSLYENGLFKAKTKFSYDMTSNKSTRLIGIDLYKPFNGSLGDIPGNLVKKTLKRFGYSDNPASPEPVQDWQMRQVTNEDGSTEVFEFRKHTIPISAGQQSFDLSAVSINGSSRNLLTLAGITDPDVFFKSEVVGKVYIGVEQRMTDEDRKGRSPKKMLIEFTNMGDFYKVSRVFQPNWTISTALTTFHMEQSGSYFVWSTNTRAQVWDLKSYRPENVILFPESGNQYNQAADFTYPTGIYHEFETVQIGKNIVPGDYDDKEIPGYSIFTFSDWFAVKSNNVNSRRGMVRNHYMSFYGLRSNALWAALDVDPTSVNSNKFGYLESKYGPRTGVDGTLAFSCGQNVSGGFCQSSGDFGDEEYPVFSNIIAQPGNDFLAVLHTSRKTIHLQEPIKASLHTYYRSLDKITEGGLVSGNQLITYCANPPPDHGPEELLTDYVEIKSGSDCTLGICGETFRGVFDLQVRGDMIGVIVPPRYRFHRPMALLYGFDGKRRHLVEKYSQVGGGAPSEKLFLHRMLLGDGYFISAIGDPGNPVQATRYGRSTGHSLSQVGIGNILGISDLGDANFNDADGFLEYGTISSRLDADQLARVRMFPDPSYMAKEKSFVFAKPRNSSGDDVINFSIPIYRDEVYHNTEFYPGKILTFGTDKFKYSVVGWNFPASIPSLLEIPFPTGWSQMSVTLLSTGAVFSNGASVMFIKNVDGKLFNASSPPSKWVIKSVTVNSKGSASKIQNGSKFVMSYSYDGGVTFYNPLQNVPNFSVVDITSPLGNTKNEYNLSDYVTSGPDIPESQVYLDGFPKISRFSKGVHESGAQRAEQRGSYRVMESLVTPSTAGVSRAKTAYTLQTKKTVDISKFWTNEKTTSIRSTFFDALNNIPKISIIKTGSEYRLNLRRFRHEFGAAVFPLDQVVEDAEYVFTSDPCSETDDVDPGDECSNIYKDDLAFLKREVNSKRAVAAIVTTYSQALLPMKTFEWRPSQLGVEALTSLDGSMTGGTWHKSGEIISRVSDNPWAKSKSDDVTENQSEDVHSIHFYGGARGDLLASIENSNSFTAGILDGEEENLKPTNSPPRFGYFGNWEPGGNVAITSELAHTGSRSFKTTGAYGVAINIPIHDQGNAFWNRNKGLMISGWLYMTGQNDDTPNDPKPVIGVEFLKTGEAPHHFIDVIGELEATSPLAYNKWVKIERLISYAELNLFAAPSDNFVRIWFGKAAIPCTPLPCSDQPVTNAAMYMDDLRIFPSDATVISRTLDERGRITSVSDQGNEPHFFNYNVFDGLLGLKNKNGKTFSSMATRLFGED